MAIATPCQTHDAEYITHISGYQVSITVILPKLLDITEDQARILDANLHNMMELVLAPYFMEET